MDVMSSSSLRPLDPPNPVPLRPTTELNEEDLATLLRQLSGSEMYPGPPLPKVSKTPSLDSEISNEFTNLPIAKLEEVVESLTFNSVRSNKLNLLTKKLLKLVLISKEGLSELISQRPRLLVAMEEDTTETRVVDSSLEGRTVSAMDSEVETEVERGESSVVGVTSSGKAGGKLRI